MTLPLRNGTRLSKRIACCFGIVAASSFLAVSSVHAATDVWQGTSSGAWFTPGNWTLGLPGTGDIAQFSTAGTATTITITMSGATNNGTANEAVGAVDILSTRGANLTLTNNATSTAGTFTLNGATVTLADSSTLSNVIIHNNSIRNLTLASGTSTMTVALGNATNNIISLEGSGNITIGSNITQVNAGSKLTLSGGGTGALILSGTNSFSGGLIITGSEVQVSADVNLGATGGTITMNGGALTATTGFTIGATRDILLGSTAGSSIGATTGQTLVYNGIFKDLSGAGNFVMGALINQTGTIQIGGVSTYTGTTTITRGTLQLTTGNDRLPTGTDVSLSSTSTSAKLDLNGFNQTIRSLSGGGATQGAVALGSGTLTINTGAATNTSYNGVISGTGGSLIVQGSGTQTLTGANTYSGATTISGGTLKLDSAGSITPRLTATTSITVNSGGTLLLANSVLATPSTDRINNSATMTLNGGTFNTGGLSERTLTGSVVSAGIGAVTLQANSIIDMASGASIIAFANSSASTWTTATTLSIWNWSGTPLTGGGTDQLYFGTDSTGLTSGQLAQVEFFSGAGTGDLGSAIILANGELVPVPEPSTWIGGALALLAVGWMQRKRLIKSRK